MDSVKKLVNREMSWLAFNERVLQEAMDKKNPLFERIRFLGIFSSNLSEFYRIRVATIKRSIKRVDIGKDLLRDIRDKVVKQRSLSLEIFLSIKKELKRHNIFLKTFDEVSPPERKKILTLYSPPIMKMLKVYRIDALSGLKDINPYLLVIIKTKGKENTIKTEEWIVEIPADILPRFVPFTTGGYKIVLFLDDIIRFHLPDFFSVKASEITAYSFKVLRDADIDVKQDNRQSFFENLNETLQLRSKGSPVRINYDWSLPPEILNRMMKMLSLTQLDCIPSWRYQNFKDLTSFPQILPIKEYRKPLVPVAHPAINLEKKTTIPDIANDILLHFPYNSFDYFLNILHAAAIDTRVKTIRITLYRLAKDSKIIESLILASQNGKRVEVVIEFNARFDEEANLHWANKLLQEKIFVYPKIALKVHAKICVITYYDEKDLKKTLSYIGTGNFNEDTLAIYSDHALLTPNPIIANELKAVFKLIEYPFKRLSFKHLLISPFDIRSDLKALINNEVANFKKGLPAKIILKLNSLCDPKMVACLYKAAKRDVHIQLLIRGICILDPDHPDAANNIEIYSIVDRYLEHSRILYFENGGNHQLYLGSADWMERNFDARIEVMTEIIDAKIKRELTTFLQLQLKDNTKTRIFCKDLKNKFKKSKALPFNFQTDFYKILPKLQKTESH